VQRESLQGDVPTWIDNLLRPLNVTVSQVLQALTENLTLGDNVIGSIRQVNVITNASGAISPVTIPWPFFAKKQPQALLLGKIDWPSNQPALTTQVQISNWTTSDQGVRILTVLGLPANSTFTLSVVIL